MNLMPFVFWKEPDNPEVFTIHNPDICQITEPQLDKEGFQIFPFTKNQPGYAFNGTILNGSKNQIPEISFEQSGDLPENVSLGNYTSLVENAVSRIKAGEFFKVVLARSVVQNLPKGFNISSFFKELCSHYTNTLVYCLSWGHEIWIGATPELFLKYNQNVFETFALAGTKKTNLSSTFGEKEKREQQYVKDYIVDLLQNNAAEEVQVSEVTVFNTGNLSHLVNHITFLSNNPGNIIQKLHPTPAVCGSPMEVSKDFISKHEHLDREYYSGYLGPIRSENEFSLWVNLRCGKIYNQQITFFGGAGIVEHSDPESEAAETENKINTLRALL